MLGVLRGHTNRDDPGEQEFIREYVATLEEFQREYIPHAVQ